MRLLILHVDRFAYTVTDAARSPLREPVGEATHESREALLALSAVERADAAAPATWRGWPQRSYWAWRGSFTWSASCCTRSRTYSASWQRPGRGRRGARRGGRPPGRRRGSRSTARRSAGSHAGTYRPRGIPVAPRSRGPRRGRRGTVSRAMHARGGEAARVKNAILAPLGITAAPGRPAGHPGTAAQPPRAGQPWRARDRPAAQPDHGRGRRLVACWWRWPAWPWRPASPNRWLAATTARTSL